LLRCREIGTHHLPERCWITLVVDVSTFEYAELWRNRDGSTSTNNNSGASTLVFSAHWKLN
jgi:hypothetical protein